MTRTQPCPRCATSIVAWLYRFPHDGESDHALSLTPFLDSWIESKGATITPLFSTQPSPEAAERRGYERGLAEQRVATLADVERADEAYRGWYVANEFKPHPIESLGPMLEALRALGIEVCDD